MGENFGLYTFVVVVALGVLSRQYVAKATHLPYTVLMMIFGGMVGIIARTAQPMESNVRSWYNLDPSVLLYCFIPILVFESAFMTDTHIFARQKWQILTLAGPGVLVSTLLTATFCKYVFYAYGWSWPVCLLLGSILSATDPVAVVSLLKELGVSERLGTLIEGESLLNDGTAIVVFDVFKHALEHSPCDPKIPGVAPVLIMLVRLGALGPVVGSLVGWGATTMLGYMLNDTLNEIAITVVACFASFTIAESTVGTSGVLSVVCCGMYLSRYGRGRISADVEHNLHSFWGVLAHIANTAVFFLAGLIITLRGFGFGDASKNCVKCRGHEEEDEGHRRLLAAFDFGPSLDASGSSDAPLSQSDGLFSALSRRLSGHSHYAEEKMDSCPELVWLDVFYLGILYLALFLIRLTVIALASPVLWRGVYGMTKSQAFVVAYGGLRGAIGLALALIVNETKHIESKLKMLILFHVSGIAMLTLCINGTTTGWLLHKLGLDSRSNAENEIFAHVARDVDKKLTDAIAALKREQYLGDADWAMVWRYLPVLSVETYWLRIADGRVVLNEAERLDLALFSKRKVESEVLAKERAASVAIKGGETRLAWVLHCSYRVVSQFQLFEEKCRRSDYPVPALLQHRWLKYHVAFGNTAPHFLRAEYSAGANHDAADDVLRQLKTSELILDAVKNNAAVRQAAGAHHALTPQMVAVLRETALRDLKGAVPPSTALKSLTPPATTLKSLTPPSTALKGPSLPPAAYTAAFKGLRISSPLKAASPKGLAQDAPAFVLDATAPFALDGAGRTLSAASDDTADHVCTFAHSAQGQGALEQPAALPAPPLMDEEKNKDDEHVDEGMLHEARARCLWAVKANYHLAFTRGRLSPSGLRVLLENADRQSDDFTQELCGWERLSTYELTAKGALQRLQDLKSYVPFRKLRDELDGVLFRQMAFVFEVAYNFIHAHADIDVSEIIDHGLVERRVVAEIERQQVLAKSTILDYVAVYPESANAVKTQVAARYALVRQHEFLRESREHGHITEKELEASANLINASRIKLESHPYTEAAPPLDRLLANVPFLSCLTHDEFQAVINDQSACRSELVLAHTTLARQGALKLEKRAEHHGRTGFFVIARGTVVTSTEYDAQGAPKDCDGSRCASHYARSAGRGADVVLSSGTVCCLEEQLLDLPFAATYRALSMVHLVFFDKKAIIALSQKNAAVRRGLWWSIALAALRNLPNRLDVVAHHRDLKALCDDAVFIEVRSSPIAPGASPVSFSTHFDSRGASRRPFPRVCPETGRTVASTALLKCPFSSCPLDSPRRRGLWKRTVPPALDGAPFLDGHFQRPFSTALESRGPRLAWTLPRWRCLTGTSSQRCRQGPCIRTSLKGFL